MLGLEDKHSNGTSYIPLANRRRTRSGLFQPSNRRQHRSVHCFPEMDGVLLTPVGKPSTTSKRDGWAELSGQAWDFPPPLEIRVTASSSAWEYLCSSRPDSPSIQRHYDQIAWTGGILPQKALSMGNLRAKEQIGFSENGSKEYQKDSEKLGEPTISSRPRACVLKLNNVTAVKINRAQSLLTQQIKCLGYNWKSPVIPRTRKITNSMRKKLMSTWKFKSKLAS